MQLFPAAMAGQVEVLLGVEAAGGPPKERCIEWGVGRRNLTRHGADRKVLNAAITKVLCQLVNKELTNGLICGI